MVGKRLFLAGRIRRIQRQPLSTPGSEKYIQNQEEHHSKRSFEQEFIVLLRSSGIAYDEQFVFG